MDQRTSIPDWTTDGQSLEMNGAEWSAVREAISGYLIIADRNRKILSMNHPAPGRPLSHFIGRDFVDFTAPDQRPMVIDACSRVLAGASAIEIVTLSAESGRWFRVRVAGIRDKGVVTGFAVHVLDIDDAMAVEHDRDVLRSQLRRTMASPAKTGSEVAYRWLDLIADAVPVLIAYIDKERRYQYNNAAYCRWFGIAPEDIRGRPVQEVLGHEAYDLIRGYVDAVLDGQASSFEHILPYKSAGLRRVVAHYVPDIDSKGNVLGFFAFVEDVTSRKTAEDNLRRREDEIRQLQKMEALGRLAGGIAHDFNNLLQTITTTCSLLLMRLQGKDDENAHEVARIKRVAERGTHMTRQLLTFSRREELVTGVIELDAFLTEQEILLGRLLESNMKFESDYRSCCHVEADAGQMQQIVMNLVINARDAMSDGGVLRIESHHVMLSSDDAAQRGGVKPGGYALISVSDTGSGMDKATLSRIFEPFFTTKSNDQGTGLGLSMVYGIVKKLEGVIEAESAPGEGTTFHLYIPCKAAHPQQ